MCRLPKLSQQLLFSICLKAVLCNLPFTVAEEPMQKSAWVTAGKYAGFMPNVKPLGEAYMPNECRTGARRLLPNESTRGQNIRACALDPNRLCDEVVRVDLNHTFNEQHTVRRTLLTRIANLKHRRRRPQGWADGHPNLSDYKFINETVRDAASTCFIHSRPCLMSSSSTSKLPYFARRSWGTCALVGLGDNVLKSSHGQDIENHDVVIRLGQVQIRGFERHIGSRTDVVTDRNGALKRDQKAHKPLALQAYLCYEEKNRYTDSKRSFSAIPSAARIRCDAKADSGLQLLYGVYARMSPKRKPLTGTAYALRLALSGLCNRLDVYGMSADGGGTYFERTALTKEKHSTELDSWILHHLMETSYEDLRMCVYL
jgi:hypothetical protein